MTLAALGRGWIRVTFQRRRSIRDIRGSLIFALCLSAAAIAQPPSPLPQFEVASIKLNTSNGRSSRTNSDRGEIFMTNVTLRAIVQSAFRLRSFALAAPDWLSSERFDISAKFTPGAKREERDLMLQALLIERFKLAVHHETRQFDGFALTVAKKGPKIHPVEDSGGHSVSSNDGRYHVERTTMAAFVIQLANEMQQPVVDSTGLAGVYTFDLTFSPDRGFNQKNDDDARPSIFTALQEQLGLKLEARKVPVDIVVVDRCERMPLDN